MVDVVVHDCHRRLHLHSTACMPAHHDALGAKPLATSSNYQGSSTARVGVRMRPERWCTFRTTVRYRHLHLHEPVLVSSAALPSLVSAHSSCLYSVGRKQRKEAETKTGMCANVHLHLHSPAPAQVITQVCRASIACGWRWEGAAPGHCDAGPHRAWPPARCMPGW